MVAEVDVAMAAGGEEEMTVLAVPQAFEWSVVALEQNRPHRAAFQG